MAAHSPAVSACRHTLTVLVAWSDVCECCLPLDPAFGVVQILSDFKFD